MIFTIIQLDLSCDSNILLLIHAKMSSIFFDHKKTAALKQHDRLSLFCLTY